MANRFQTEYIKCYQDKTAKYFIQNYLSTFNADKRTETPFHLFPRQRAFLHSLTYNQNTIAIKPRQAGITTVSAGWCTYRCVFADPKAPETVLCIANNLDTSQQFLEKMENFLNQVPRWMWGSDFYHADKEHEKNKRSIYVAKNKSKIELFNGCKIYARSSGKNAARGISAVSICVFDEAGAIENGPEVYSQAVACMSSFGAAARTIMVSTPKGKDQLYYATYSKALRGENNYTAVEFRWYQDPRYNRFLRWSRKSEENGEVEWYDEPTINSSGDVQYDEEHWAEMVRNGWKPTSPWYITMCNTFNQNQMLIDQELNVSFLGSSDNVVPVDTIEMQRDKNVIDLPENWHLHDPFVKETWIWKEPIAGHRYILAIDNSSGSSEDSTGLHIIDIDAVDENGTPFIEQVLEYNGKITGDIMAEIAFKYGRTYNDALIVVEDIGGYGESTILGLLNMKYPNMYFDDPGLRNAATVRKYNNYHINAKDKLPGFHTNNVRFQMVMKLSEYLTNNGLRVHSKRFVNELDTWVFNKSGRPDHMAGFHDDLLTCMAMALYVMEFSVLRNDGMKKKDAAMLSAWMKNTPKQISPFAKTVERNISTISKQDARKFNPFGTTVREQQKSMIKGCLMLGGFSNEKYRKKTNSTTPLKPFYMAQR